jgi:hypothetical protein
VRTEVGSFKVSLVILGLFSLIHFYMLMLALCLLYLGMYYSNRKPGLV